MTTEQQNDIEPASELADAPDISRSTKTTTKKSKWLLLIGTIALFVGGAMVWRYASISESSSEEPRNNIEQARLAVRTVPANLDPIQAWTYGDGNVSAIIKKHLTFQAEGTINYIKKVDGRDLREGDRVREGELLARLDRRKYDADITVVTGEQIEAKKSLHNVINKFSW